MEFIRFNDNEIIIMNSLFRPGTYDEANNTIFIDNFDGDSILIQYYLLSPTKLLFIMTDANNFEQNLTLVLTKL
jgi:hypothetical protein